MVDDDATAEPTDEPQAPDTHELPDEVTENLEEVAPVPAPIPDPGPLLPR